MMGYPVDTLPAFDEDIRSLQQNPLSLQGMDSMPSYNRMLHKVLNTVQG